MVKVEIEEEPVEAPGDVVEAVGETGDVVVVVQLELPQGDQGEEEDWEKGEEGVRHTLAPHRTELSIL